MIKCIAIVIVFLVAGPAAIAARSKVSEQVEIETIDSVPIVELWAMTSPSKTNSGEVSVISQLYDPEMRPRRGNWMGCAIVLIGTGDLGIRPVAFRVWSRRDCQLVISKLPTENARKLTFTMEIGKSENLLLSILNGESVSVQGIAIGSIKQPK